MKKLLSLVGAISFIVVPSTTIVSCAKHKPSPSPDDNDDNTLTALAKAEKIFNDGIADYYNNQKNIFDTTKVGTFVHKNNDDVFNNLFDMTEKAWDNDNHQPITFHSDSDYYYDIVDFISGHIKEMINDTNKKIKKQIPLFWDDSGLPLTIQTNTTDPKTPYQALGVDMKYIRANEVYKQLSISSISFTYSFRIMYKDTSINLDKKFNFIFTNDKDKYNAVIGDYVNIIRKDVQKVFDVDRKEITSDKKFENLYNILDLDFSKDDSDLQNIYESKINQVIADDISIKPEFKSALLINNTPSERIVRINNTNLALNNIMRKYLDHPTDSTSPYAWYNTNRTSKGTDFASFYKKLRNITSVKEQYKIAKVDLNDSSITAYGLPLQGLNTQSQELVINAKFLDQKLTNFGQLMVDFFNYYQTNFYKYGPIASGQSPILHVASDLSDWKGLDYKHFLDKLLSDFKSKGLTDEQKQSLPEYKDFYLVNAQSDDQEPTGTDWRDYTIPQDGSVSNANSIYTLGKTSHIFYQTDFAFAFLPKIIKHNSDIKDSYLYYTAFSRTLYVIYVVKSNT